jgi:hypothetical protein
MKFTAILLSLQQRIGAAEPTTPSFINVFDAIAAQGLFSGS